MPSNLITGVTTTGAKYLDTLQSTSTTDSTVSFSGLGTVGFYQLTNTDITDTIEVGFNTDTDYPIKIGPGQTMLAFNNGATTHVKSTANTPVLGVRAIEA